MRREILKKMLKIILIALLIQNMQAEKIFAAEIYKMEGQEELETIYLNINASEYVNLGEKITRMVIGNSKIAKVIQLPPSDTEFIVTSGAEAGTTTLFLWTENGGERKILICVSKEDLGQAKLIEQAINLSGVRVKKIDDRILLTGTVKNQYERNYALQTAMLFVGRGLTGNLNFGSNANMEMTTQNSNENVNINLAENKKIESSAVIDLLQMTDPSQIRIEAQIIAIRPQDSRNLGILYGANPNGNDNTVSAPGIFYFGESHEHQHADINLSVQALVTKSQAKILSRPSITTLSGEEALIQVGGEIPYRTIGENGIPKTDFKDYGIILQLKPFVDAENRITSSVHAEVSSMSGETVDGNPILDRRRADAVITMRSGSTMVIGGLMDSSERKTITKFPFLGDIPILGEFFKYTSKSKDKQELIILLTPYLVNEEDSSKIKMTGTMKEFYTQKTDENKNLEKIDVNGKN